MTRRPARSDTEALVETILDRRLDAFRHWRDAFGENPSAEPVHEVRVATRRLLAALTLFQPLLELPGEVAPAALRRVERRLGKLRDLDVLGDRIRAAALQAASHEHGGDTAQLEATLGAARTEALERARSAIGRKRLRQAISGLRSWLEDSAFTPIARLPLALLATDLLQPILSRVLLEAGWQVTSPPAPDSRAAGALHALRRRLKELRYAVECLSDWYGDPVGEWLSELHEIQDALGAWRDEGLLLERLREAAGTSILRSESLLRAQEALRLWPVWRRRYLDPAPRAAFRRLIGTTPTVPDAARPGYGGVAGPSRHRPRSPDRTGPDAGPGA
jgi:CHAD domain-containing protein